MESKGSRSAAGRNENSDQGLARSTESIKMGTINICGWTRNNYEWRKGIFNSINSDIICVYETHLAKDGVINVPGFSWFGYIRVGIQTNLDRYNASIIKRSFDGILGLKFENRMNDSNFLVFAYYLSPENSCKSCGKSRLSDIITEFTVTHCEHVVSTDNEMKRSRFEMNQIPLEFMSSELRRNALINIINDIEVKHSQETPENIDVIYENLWTAEIIPEMTDKI
ncbi:unnamed protein product [Mytilus coruscus]|uniref:Endonuclease/exonuclease/phosphatase domain-containing protein n=1 Tax=Mytilus coruscus TaxID=42192 RepID=A0A6J8ELM0_MYTCO|nr:unnamed protein product [Mytilus coruscus]